MSINNNTDTFKSAYNETALAMNQIDLGKISELGARLASNPELFAEFINDPSSIAKREVDFDTPSGIHLHFIDTSNQYFPPEGNAEEQVMKGMTGNIWGRIEHRVGGGSDSDKFCIGICGICI